MMHATQKARPEPHVSPPPTPLRVINRACVASDAGRCLACDARQGEPCRRLAAVNR